MYADLHRGLTNQLTSKQSRLSESPRLSETKTAAKKPSANLIRVHKDVPIIPMPPSGEEIETQSIELITQCLLKPKSPPICFRALLNGAARFMFGRVATKSVSSYTEKVRSKHHKFLRALVDFCSKMRNAKDLEDSFPLTDKPCLYCRHPPSWGSKTIQWVHHMGKPPAHLNNGIPILHKKHDFVSIMFSLLEPVLASIPAERPQRLSRGSRSSHWPCKTQDLFPDSETAMVNSILLWIEFHKTLGPPALRLLARWSVHSLEFGVQILKTSACVDAFERAINQLIPIFQSVALGKFGQMGDPELLDDWSSPNGGLEHFVHIVHCLGEWSRAMQGVVSSDFVRLRLILKDRCTPLLALVDTLADCISSPAFKSNSRLDPHNHTSLQIDMQSMQTMCLQGAHDGPSLQRIMALSSARLSSQGDLKDDYRILQLEIWTHLKRCFCASFRCGNGKLQLVQEGAVLQKCSGCRLFQYCSQSCQTFHWKDPQSSHKLVCSDMRVLSQIYTRVHDTWQKNRKVNPETAFEAEARVEGYDEAKMKKIAAHLRRGLVLTTHLDPKLVSASSGEIISVGNIG